MFFLTPECSNKLDDMMAANGKDRERLWTLYYFSRCKSLYKTAQDLGFCDPLAEPPKVYTSTARRVIDRLAEEIARQPDGNLPDSHPELIENDRSRENRTRLTAFGELVVAHVEAKFEDDYRRKTGGQ